MAQQVDGSKMAGFVGTVDTEHGVTFAVRVVLQGQRYGLNDACTNKGPAPLVELYDTRYMHTPVGQFVARYNLGTLLQMAPHRGLMMDAGAPSWRLDGAAFASALGLVGAFMARQ